MTPIPQRVLDRIWSRVQVGDPDRCWPYLLGVGNHHYGSVGWWDKDAGRDALGRNGRSRGELAHRIAWVATHGPIPDDLTVDHICRNTICCNPRHLRLLTNEDNAADNYNARKTECIHGHPFDDANTWISADGRRRACRACRRLRYRARRVAA